MFFFENLRGKLARGLAKIEPFANADNAYCAGGW